MANEQLEPISSTADERRDRIHRKTLRALKGTFPVVGKRFTVDVEELDVSPTAIDPAVHKRALMGARTLSEPVRGTLVLRNNKSGKVVQKVPQFNMLQLPYFTDHHTFVIGGNSYSIANQLRMRPGVYTRKRRNEDLEAAFNLGKGQNFRLTMDPTKGHFHMEYGTTRIPLYPVLQKMGVSDKEMTGYWNKALVTENRNTFAGKADKVVGKLYDRVIHPYNQVAGEDKVEALKRTYADTQLDPEVTRETLGKPFDHVSPGALLSATQKLLKVFKENIDYDERDSLAYKQIRSVDDFIGERIKLEGRPFSRKIVAKLDRAGATPNLREMVPSSPFTKSVRQFLSTSALSNTPDQINPIEVLDSALRVTSLGPGGIASERAIPNEARHLHTTHVGILDPIRTPESSRVGIDLRTALFALRDREGNLYTPLYDRRKKQIRRVPVSEVVKKVVAFPNQQMRGSVDVIANGRVQSVSASKVDLVVPHIQSMYSPASTLIPFMDSIDGNRATMGAKMQTQALPLVNAESPLIQVASYRPGQSVEEDLGRRAVPYAPVAGTVTRVRDGIIYIRPRGAKVAAESKKVHYYQNFPLASKTFLHHDVTVKAGDEVQKGQALADAPFVQNGQLALGTNLKTAYLPYRGLNSNDAIVVSESGAKKLTSRHMFREGLDLEADMRQGREEHRAYFGNKYTKEIYDKLDRKGLVKPGTRIEKGDMLLAVLQKHKLNPEAQMLGKLHKSLVRPFRDTGLTWEHDYPGVVEDVQQTGRKIRMTVKMDAPLQIGDKLSGRYGNKGVISAIIPDEQMVQSEDGKPIDLLLSPASVISRINPAQILETALAKVAKKTGKPILVENFADRDNVKYVKEELKKHGLSDTETVFDPMTGKKIHKVLVGPQYIMKLFKSTETNYSARGVEDYDTNLQPSRGGSHGAKKIGRLVFNGLLAHDARNILQEAASLKGQKNDEFWRAYQLGLPPPPLATSFAYDKFGAMLAGAGVKMNKVDNHISLGPLTDHDTTELSSGAIREPTFVRAKDLKPEQGGLFDPATTGGTMGTKWAHVNLHEPIVNPIFERPVRTLLGLKAGDYEKVIREEGGKGIQKRLGRIDLNQREREVLERLKRVKSAERDRVIKELKYIRTLKINKMRPEEAYVISKLPVIPPQFRPIVPGRTGDLQVSDANFLYRDAMLADDLLSKSDEMPLEVRGDARKHLNDAVGALYGLREAVSPQLQARNVRGFISRIAGTGGGPKTGFLHSKLLTRLQDISGRGTIAPDSTMGMDEIGLPEEMGWSMYTPFITRGLVQLGYPAIRAREMIEEHHPMAREVLNRELRERPVLVNRAPTLYRHNIIAAYPRLVPGRTLRVHESFAPTVSGDFDGDAVQVFSPVGTEAVHEAKSMTLPHMLLSDRSKFTLSKAAPQQEAISGIYRATSVKAKGKQRRFKSRAEAMAAYHRGEIGLDTPVQIGKR